MRFSESASGRDVKDSGQNEGETSALDLSASEYSASDGLQRRFSAFVLHTYQPTFRVELEASHQALDIGCATGAFTRDGILPRCLPFRRIVGVDCSPEMIEHARRHSVHDELEYRVLDIASDVSGFLEEFGQFDRVYSFYCLHWVDDLALALKNVARLMTPTGECLLVFYASHESVPVWRALAGMDRWKKYSEVLLKFVPRSQDMEKEEQHLFLSKLLAESGLRPKIMQIVRSSTYDGCTKKEMLKTQMAVLPIAKLVPLQHKAQLIADVTEEARLVHAPHSDKERYRMYIVMASKDPDCS